MNTMISNRLYNDKLNSGGTINGTLTIGKAYRDNPLELRGSNVVAFIDMKSYDGSISHGSLYARNTNNQGNYYAGLYYNNKYHNFAYASEIPDVSDKVNCVYTSQGSSLTFTPRAGNENCHALVCVGNGNLALLWCDSGAVHITNFAGDTGITATRNNKSVTVNRSSAETITIWY